jgi:hypothetical protein
LYDNEFYRKTVALESIINRNTGAAKIMVIRILSGVGGPVNLIIIMAGQPTVAIPPYLRRGTFSGPAPALPRALLKLALKLTIFTCSDVTTVDVSDVRKMSQMPDLSGA